MLWHWHRFKERGIKIAAFQHGITREILANVDERRVFFETSFCDVFFAMNSAAAKITERHSVNQPVTVVTKIGHHHLSAL